jgi:hypothetical protein
VSEGWYAVFVDGPMAEGHHDRHFTGGMPAVLYFAPIPERGLAGTAVPPTNQREWMWVGDAKLPPDVPWEDQVMYVAVDDIPADGGTVRFRLESQP